MPGLEEPDGKCNAGFYCKESAPAPRPLDENVDVDYSNYGACPIGYYCEEETENPVACPAGKYYPSTHATHEDDCIPCPEGKMCTVAGLGGWDEVCPAGYYC
mmetsp:Transcript_27381/g.12749  ORF Transcript_27381/g.12749 Transcript_27381/m.12749 type:complete len:102 (+) Transcript_27381:53-358(+)